MSDPQAVRDILIAGAGPGGTAAAFRAKELGLSALVIDYDDILKRIREYAKNKPILPNFGGGDRMRFPAGGSLFSRLHFSPIDKDEMVVQWKQYYVDAGIDVCTGVELLGLDQGADKIWNVRCWNHKDKAEVVFRARHVVIGIGRGVPRRFDIPGNTAGIAFRLEDAAAYVGGPVCIIGGGTSAAEAVIAISNAKTNANDPSNVFWSYRGDKLPRVSKALADVFFAAYLGNGNVRYYPLSEPTAIVLGDDKLEYLAIRTDRRTMPNRPCESSILEFRKDACVACIGEDIPEKLLSSMGIFMVTGGADGTRLMLVDKNLQTRLENVYMIGAILAPAYFETDDFAADPSTYREVLHRDNIKASLLDGWRVVEVIRRKLAGEPTDHIEIQYADAEPEAAAAAAPVRAAPVAASAVPAPPRLVESESAGPPNASILPERRVRGDEARLIRLLSDGVQENEYTLRSDVPTTVGRMGCDVCFPDDVLLSDQHASIIATPDGYVLRDDASATGVYFRMRSDRDIEVGPGTILRLGRQFLVFGADGGRPYFVHWDDQGNRKARYDVRDGELIVGRESQGLSLDPTDMSLSRRHLAIESGGGRIRARDLASSNGTFVKIDGAARLEHGDKILIGQQLFVFSRKEGVPVDAGHRPAASVIEPRPPAPRPQPAAAAAPPAPRPQPAAAAAAAPAAAPAPAATPASPKPAVANPPEAPAAAGAITVTFRELGRSFALRSGQTICELAEENGLEVTADCHEGTCGSDPILIVSGGENLNAMDVKEKSTLRQLKADLAGVCDIVPGTHRLACVARPAGPVVVEIVRR